MVEAASNFPCKLDIRGLVFAYRTRVALVLEMFSSKHKRRFIIGNVKASSKSSIHSLFMRIIDIPIPGTGGIGIYLVKKPFIIAWQQTPSHIICS